MKTAYVTVLSTDSYLPGVLVLYKSLMKTLPVHPFLTLLTTDISTTTHDALNRHNIAFSVMDKDIMNPHEGVDTEDRWYHTYAKLGIFGLSQYDKIVYLDADMIILQNIDELFDKPHMSAVNAGGLLPENAHWIQLNSGLMVIEPSDALFKDMVSKIGKIEQAERKDNYSDQGFLHAYYPDWPQHTELHLSHVYNMFDCLVAQHRESFGYWIKGMHPEGKENSKQIKIVHFIGKVKPWNEHPGWDEKDDWARTRRFWIYEYENLSR